MRFIYTECFKEEIKKHVQNKPNLKKRIEECIFDFEEKLFDSKYYRKPLKGFSAEDVHELQVGWDPRIFVQFFRKDNECYFLNFGTHASLELKSSKRIQINLIRKQKKSR